MLTTVFSSSLKLLYHHKPDTFPRQNLTAVKPSLAGLVFEWVSSKYTTFCERKRTVSSILMLKKCKPSKVQILLAPLMENKIILIQK